MEAPLPAHAHYQFKFLHAAINELVVGPGDVRHRLIYAADPFLCVVPESSPQHLRSDIGWIRHYLTEFKAIPGMHFPYDSDVRVTMRRRRTATAVRCAERMWSLYFLYRSALDASS